VVIKSLPIQLADWTWVHARGMTAEEFSAYVGGLSLPGHSLFLHHTWKPTVESWRGMQTMLAMKGYYEQQRWKDARGQEYEGWTAGPHIFVAPDGIWLFSALREDGVGVAGHNYHSRHVEMVGNYDLARPEGEVLRLTVITLALLCGCMGLEAEEILFHRDFSTKTCPGKMVSKDWIHGLVRGYLISQGKEHDE